MTKFLYNGTPITSKFLEDSILFQKIKNDKVIVRVIIDNHDNAYVIGFYDADEECKFTQWVNQDSIYHECMQCSGFIGRELTKLHIISCLTPESNLSFQFNYNVDTSDIATYLDLSNDFIELK